jgi:hypothetical protein
MSVFFPSYLVKNTHPLLLYFFLAFLLGTTKKMSLETFGFQVVKTPDDSSGSIYDNHIEKCLLILRPISIRLSKSKTNAANLVRTLLWLVQDIKSALKAGKPIGAKIECLSKSPTKAIDKNGALKDAIISLAKTFENREKLSMMKE